jgi:hypothetical protein
MLGRRSPQTSFADSDEWYQRIPARSVWTQVRAWTAAHIHDEDYADWYQETGRPSIPPSFVMPLLLLKLRQGWSDREAAEAAFYDDRVKFARGVGRSPEIQIERSTLCQYRGRVLATDTGQALRRTTLGARLAADGLRGAAPARYCVGGPRGAHGPAAGVGSGQRHQLTRSMPPATGARLITAVVVTPANTGDGAALTGAAPDRVIFTVDPAMPHGWKTTATKVDGYQRHQLTESVPPATGPRRPRCWAAADRAGRGGGSGAAPRWWSRCRPPTTGWGCLRSPR